MVSCWRIFVVLIPLLLSLGALVLGALACAGGSKNHVPVDQIYEFRLNVSELDVSKLISSNTILGMFSSLTDVTISASDLGLSDIYSVGQWGYCKGNSTDDGEYEVTYCSDPKAMYIFDPVEMFVSDLTDGSISITADDLTLPDDIEDSRNKLKIVSKIIFITTCIGVVAAFLVFVFTAFSFCSHVISCIASIFALLSFLALIISAAASTATYRIAVKQFNDSYDDYGFKATTSNNRYYGLIWGACICALLTVVFNVFAICCGRVRAKRSPPPPMEKEPFMGYEERHVV